MEKIREIREYPGIRASSAASGCNILGDVLAELIGEAIFVANEMGVSQYTIGVGCSPHLISFQSFIATL
jgi:hypothetical protein